MKLKKKKKKKKKENKKFTIYINFEENKNFISIKKI